MDRKRVGEVIAEAREAKGLTREQLATELGCSYITVARWEKGRKMPMRVFRRKLQEILDLSDLPTA